ncbi:FAD-dependent oxidoreductase [Kitasatospora sp. NPDC048365]|uniref:FAD-dependent oxidoreductase n=1 Tax=Kitasatospora sp. NPDC048365 TaxID=3364050 RepID=UPI00371F91EB
MIRTLVVVGHGMVGHHLIEQLRARDRTDAWRVVVLAEESVPAYDRVALSSSVEGRGADHLALAGPGFLDDPSIHLLLDTTALAVDRRRRLVRCDDGTVVHYDALVLATGARPFVPPVPGHDLPGCHRYRTLADLDGIRAAARPGRAGVVIGGGLLGLEAANALRLLGMRPHVVELAPRLMPVQVDDGGGAVLARLIAALGVELHLGIGTAAVEACLDGRVRRVRLADGSAIDTGLVVFAAGVRPRDELARGAGLAVGERGGVLVDDRCRTEDPRIWAVGDCAAVEGRCYGLVAPGYRMAESVVGQLLGVDSVPFAGADTATRLKLLGVEVASLGDAHATTAGAVELAYTDAAAGTYAKLVLAEDGRTLLGAVLAGDASAFGALRPYLGKELPTSPDQLLARP